MQMLVLHDGTPLMRFWSRTYPIYDVVATSSSKLRRCKSAAAVVPSSCRFLAVHCYLPKIFGSLFCSCRGKPSTLSTGRCQLLCHDQRSRQMMSIMFVLLTAGECKCETGDL